MSGNKLYVGNLNFNTVESAVEDAFGAYGTVVRVNLISDRETGRPRGFGFVEMSSPEEAAAAREALDGTQLDGRNIRVDEAQDRRGGGGGGGGYRGGGGGGYRGGGGGGGRW